MNSAAVVLSNVLVASGAGPSARLTRNAVPFVSLHDSDTRFYTRLKMERPHRQMGLRSETLLGCYEEQLPR